MIVEPGNEWEYNSVVKGGASSVRLELTGQGLTEERLGMARVAVTVSLSCVGCLRGILVDWMCSM